jgi:hypothetical protein
VKSNEIVWKGKWIRNWFSNMIELEKPMVKDGISYRTTEHFYQAMKTTDNVERKRISELETGGKAKRAGRKIERNGTLRESWDALKIDYMIEAQDFRFENSESFYLMLMNETPLIVEWNNWHDNYWGDCVCDKCKDIKGGNVLGKILMSIRELEQEAAQ